MSRALDALREEIRGLRPRYECLAGPAAVNEVERCRNVCEHFVQELKSSVDGAQEVMPVEEPSAAEMEVLVAQRDKLRAAVAERTAFLEKSQLDLQALASDLNTLLINADMSAAGTLQ